MKNSGMLLIALVSFVFFSGCTKISGEGPVVTETRDRGDFSAIKVSISGDVYFKQAPTYSIELQAQPNILEVIETPVISNELVVKFRNNVRVQDHDKITVIISGPNVNKLTLNGSGNFKTVGAL